MKPQELSSAAVWKGGYANTYPMQLLGEMGERLSSRVSNTYEKI